MRAPQFQRTKQFVMLFVVTVGLIAGSLAASVSPADAHWVRRCYRVWRHHYWATQCHQVWVGSHEPPYRHFNRRHYDYRHYDHRHYR